MTTPAEQAAPIREQGNEKPDFYCWPCDKRFVLRGDGFPPQSGIITCRRCGSTDVFWLNRKGMVGCLTR